MLLVLTTLGPSSIQGIGLFAAEDIPKGTVTWRWDSRIDKEIPWKTAELLPKPAQALLRTYAYREVEHQLWMLCGDNARHMNHSFDSNVKSSGLRGDDHAVRDIKAGEEMTIDYRLFDPDFEKEATQYL